MSAPVMVQPSCVQTASIAVNTLALVRDSRNTPATDCTSAAPPTSVSGEAATVTRTVVPANWPLITPSGDAMLLPGDDGDEELLPHAVNSVAIVAPEATWQAPPQNRRREI